MELCPPSSPLVTGAYVRASVAAEPGQLVLVPTMPVRAITSTVRIVFACTQNNFVRRAPCLALFRNNNDGNVRIIITITNPYGRKPAVYTAYAAQRTIAIIITTMLRKTRAPRG